MIRLRKNAFKKSCNEALKNQICLTNIRHEERMPEERSYLILAEWNDF